MSISIIRVEPLATGVRFGPYSLIVSLADAREIAVPLEWIPGLRDAKAQQRKDWRLIAGGVGIHWNELDEDVMVEDLLAFSSPPRPRSRGAARAPRKLKKAGAKPAVRR